MERELKLPVPMGQLKENWKLRLLNRVSMKVAFERVVKGSVAVLDQAYSIRELLEKFTRHIDPKSLGIVRGVVEGRMDAEFDDQPAESLARMDSVDKMEVVQIIRDVVSEGKRKLTERQAAAKAAAADNQAPATGEGKREGKDATTKEDAMSKERSPEVAKA